MEIKLLDPKNKKEYDIYIKELIKKINKVTGSLSQKKIRKTSKPEEKKVEDEKEKAKNLEIPIITLFNKVDQLIKINNQLVHDKLLAHANLENEKKQLYEEQMQIRKYRASNVIYNLLPVIDNFERALIISKSQPEIKPYLIGFEFIYKNLIDVLNNEGIRKIKVAKNDSFDHNIHHAVDSEANDEIKEDHIIQVKQEGYYHHDKVLRHASVVVCKKEIKLEPKNNEVKEKNNIENKEINIKNKE